MTAISSMPLFHEQLSISPNIPQDSTNGVDLPRKVEDAVDAKRGIGERIKQARLQAGLQQFEVA
jgi:hypothetical protein